MQASISHNKLQCRTLMHACSELISTCLKHTRLSYHGLQNLIRHMSLFYVFFKTWHKDVKTKNCMLNYRVYLTLNLTHWKSQVCSSKAPTYTEHVITICSGQVKSTQLLFTGYISVRASKHFLMF